MIKGKDVFIDTVKFTTREFNFDESRNKLRHRIDEKNGEIGSELWYFNTDKKQEGRQYQVSISSKGLLFKCSMPLFYGYKDNTHGLNREQTREALESIIDTLRDLGIETRLEYLHITRLDITKDIELSNNYAIYESILRGLRMKRGKTGYREQTYTTGNRQQEIEFYNKKRELLEKQHIEIDGELMRCEVKLLTTAKNKEKGFIEPMDIVRNWERLGILYREIVGELLDIEIDEREAGERITRLELLQKCGTLPAYYKAKGVVDTYETMDLEDIKNILKSQNSRQYVYKQIKYLKQEYERLQGMGYSGKYAKYYKELKDKLIGTPAIQSEKQADKERELFATYKKGGFNAEKLSRQAKVVIGLRYARSLLLVARKLPGNDKEVIRKLYASYTEKKGVNV